MDPFTILVLFSVFMFFGSYLAGSVPLVFSLSQSRLQLVTALGAGLLVGTALAIIIPEGMETVFKEVSAVEQRELFEATMAARNLNPETPVDESHQLDTAAAVVPVSPHPEHSHTSSHFFIGVSMSLGFVFMLLVDQLASSHTSSQQSVEGGTAESLPNHVSTTTIGLLIHSAADGIALGAAANLANTELETIIFLAIMLHKAPAGFGLVSFLLHEGCNRNMIRFHLLAFSLAAPITALVSHFCFVNVIYASNLPITGLAMLFSAGTFLYVATVHVLTEVTQHRSGTANGDKLNMKELAAVICGILLPLTFNAIHVH